MKIIIFCVQMLCWASDNLGSTVQLSSALDRPRRRVPTWTSAGGNES